MIRWISKDDDQYFGDVALLSPFKIFWLDELLLPLVLQTKMALCKTTPPAISLAEYTLYSPLLCWYFWQSKCSLKISLVLHRHRRVAWGSRPAAWNLWAGTSSLCFRPLRPFVKFAILNSIICLPLFDVCGQWPLLVIFWFFAQLWACCNNFCVVGSPMCYQFFTGYPRAQG